MVNTDTHLLQLPKTLKFGVILYQQSLLLSAQDIEFLGLENLLCNRCSGKPVWFLHLCHASQPWQISTRRSESREHAAGTVCQQVHQIHQASLQPRAGIPAHQSAFGSLNTSPSLQSRCTARAGSASSHHHSCTAQNYLCYFVRNICSLWDPQDRVLPMPARRAIPQSCGTALSRVFSCSSAW